MSIRKMRHEEAERIVKTKAPAYCDSCGHSWKIDRGDGFKCPACLNCPETVILSGRLVWLDDSERMRWL